jgi:hypothetical protein
MSTGMSTAKRFEGYHHERTLPIKAGDKIMIPKGVMVRHRGETVPAKRSYRVRVHHVLPGQNLPPGQKGHDSDYDVKNPSVRWAGAGGYWSEVDINDVWPPAGEMV